MSYGYVYMYICIYYHLQASNGKVSHCRRQLSFSQPKYDEIQAAKHLRILSQERKDNVQAGNNTTFFDKPPTPLFGPLPQVLCGVVDSRPTLLQDGVRRPYVIKGICIDCS